MITVASKVSILHCRPGQFSIMIEALIESCLGRQCNIDTFDETVIISQSGGQCNICGALHWKLEEDTRCQYTNTSVH